MTWKAKAVFGAQYFGPEFRAAKFVDDKRHDLINFEMNEVSKYSFSDCPPPLHGEEAISFMQAVMDAAYEYGLRPSAAQDERHLKAHLKDMQEISRHLLKMDKK